MTSDPKMQRLAALLVGKHGDDALAVATERILGRLAVRDCDSALLWTRVAEAVASLVPHTKAGRAAWRLHAPLRDLMEDPLMEIVVQEDDERRRVVHDTLKRAKRKLERDGE
jgi:hypothetical protein